MPLDLAATFQKHDREYLKFELVESPRHPRPDVCAFLMLHDLAPTPNDQDMVDAAEHDEIWLNVDVARLADAATEAQIVDLIRCGVRLDTGFDRLAMFV